MHRQIDKSDGTANAGPKLKRADAFSKQYDRAMQISKYLWTSPAAARPAIDSLSAEGPMHPIQYAQHRLDKRSKQNTGERPTQPFQGTTAPKAYFYAGASAQDVDGFLQERQHRKLKPNVEQFAVLQGVAKRITSEMRREQSKHPEIENAAEEPMLDLIHGLPGTGKKRSSQMVA